MSTIDVEADIKRLKAEEQAQNYESAEDDNVVYVYPRWTRVEILLMFGFALAVLVSIVDMYGSLVCK